MKDLETIERLLDVAEAINYYKGMLNRRIEETEKYIRLCIMGNEDWFAHTNNVFKRMIRILEGKYNRLLNELK